MSIEKCYKHTNTSIVKYIKLISTSKDKYNKRKKYINRQIQEINVDKQNKKHNTSIDIKQINTSIDKHNKNINTSIDKIIK